MKHIRLVAFLVGFLFASIFFFSDWISADIGEIAVQLSEKLFPGYDGFTPVALSVLLFVLPLSVIVDWFLSRKSNMHGFFVKLLVVSVLGYLTSLVAYLLLFGLAVSMFSTG